MTWANFYLVCFVTGFTLSLFSVLAGHLHLPVKLHLPHGHLLHGHLPHAGLPHAPAGHAGSGAAHPGAGGADHAPSGSPVPAVNFGTLTAFLAWFGGTGYLLTQYYRFWFLLGLGIALVSGLAGASVVFWVLAHVLVSRDENLDPADYSMVGALGRVSSSIRAGGTGEIIFSLAGTRRTSGARSEDGIAIPKGNEVVVTRYERGIAYVRRWEDLTNPDGGPESPGLGAAPHAHTNGN